MRVNSRLVLSILAAMLAVGFAGCSDKGPRTVPVEGRVTYNGKPVADGFITFMPNDGPGSSDLQPASGELDSDGNYRLHIFRQKDGVMPGEYSVGIAAYRTFVLPLSPGAKPDYSIPEKYVNPQTSGLRATVSADAGSPLRFDFELRD